MQNSQRLIEDLDYAQTPDQSIWGEGDADTWTILHECAVTKILHGDWLHFAAGDGRYNNWLLDQVERVTVSDLDTSALEKLMRVTPESLRDKLRTHQQDITERFPFADGSFDGVFNTGTLHLFPKTVIGQIISEVGRVLKPHGLFVFDFATETKRERADGSLIQFGEEVYASAQAKELLTQLLTRSGFSSDFFHCTVPPEEVTDGSGTYQFSCSYWLVKAIKR